MAQVVGPVSEFTGRVADPQLRSGAEQKPLTLVQDSCTLTMGKLMASETTYTKLRANLAAVLDQVVDGREVVVVRRKNGRDVALVPAEELAGLEETAHLLRSPRNARRLLGALRRAEKRQGKSMSVGQLRGEIRLGSVR